MAKIEEEKLVLVEQREIADRERSIARTEKMDQIFMYEGRIKEMKLLITKPKETGEKEVQTDECKIEYVSEDENEEQIVENKGQRPKSASSRLKVFMDFEKYNFTRFYIPFLVQPCTKTLILWCFRNPKNSTTKIFQKQGLCLKNYRKQELTQKFFPK